MARVLIAEDDREVRAAVAFMLLRDGHEVIEAADGDEALMLAATLRPDLIVLDLGMPKVHGMEVLRRLRSRSQVPVLVLTSRSQQEELIAGLDGGADDYVTKPFGGGELSARVRALLRRPSGLAVPTDGLLEAGPISIDVAARRVTIAGRPVKLTPNEFRLLTLFASRPGRVFSSQEVAQALRGVTLPERDALSGARVLVVRLRNKIEPDPAQPIYLRTARGNGYYLEVGDLAERPCPDSVLLGA